MKPFSPRLPKHSPYEKYSSNIVNELITKNLPEIRRLCELHRVERLDVFGSVTGDHFSEGSDIDFLVHFERDGYAGAFSQLMDLKNDLEELFQREVDLVIDRQFRNPVFADRVKRSRENLYAA